MTTLGAVFEGWDGYQTSIRHAIDQPTAAQLNWRPAPRVRSLGEVIRHVSLGRVNWLARMGAPGIDEVVRQVPNWYIDADEARHVVEDSVPSDDPQVLAHWLELSWGPIQSLLAEWTVDHLFHTYTHQFRGVRYKLSNQWTLWRIMSHDLHHGGQITMMLACQKIPAPELRSLGGHLTVPPEA